MYGGRANQCAWSGHNYPTNQTPPPNTPPSRPPSRYTYAYAIGLVAMIILTSTVMQYLYVHRGLHAIALMFKKVGRGGGRGMFFTSISDMVFRRAD